MPDNETNVEKFFRLAAEDASVSRKLNDLLASYPGSLEVRESVVENVLLPVAAEAGLPFTVQELRTYETQKKLRSRKKDVPPGEDEEIEDPEEYWLLDYGWEWDETLLKE